MQKVLRTGGQDRGGGRWPSWPWFAVPVAVLLSLAWWVRADVAPGPSGQVAADARFADGSGGSGGSGLTGGAGEGRSGVELVEEAAGAQVAGGVAAIRAGYTPHQAAECARTVDRCLFYDAIVVRERVAATLHDRYPGRFAYRRTGIDFEDLRTGERIELTTRRRFSPHLSRTGEYVGARFVFYRVG